jgi:3-oxoacyl-[acyl-carrier-protein] synthase II
MRVYITGMGIWCSLGHTLGELEEGLRQGRSGPRPITRFETSSSTYRTNVAATLAHEDELVLRSDATYIADLILGVADKAIEDAGLAADWPTASRIGAAVGTSHGGNLALMKFIRGLVNAPGGSRDADLLISHTPTLIGQLVAKLGLGGPTLTVSTACASGTNSIGRAAELIASGAADVMVAGGADVYTELSFSGFNVLGVTARETCRPCDQERDGMMLGDGAAMVVLESEERVRRRGARAYAIVAGHAIGSDAYHATAPEPDGATAARMMREALAGAELGPADIDYVNLHGTGTVANDPAELAAVAKVFGERASKVLLSSTKSQVGHTLGAAGSVELVATALGMARGFAPPSINLRTPIAGYEHWSFVRDQARPARIRAAISNSFGFAGSLASIVLKAAV